MVCLADRWAGRLGPAPPPDAPRPAARPGDEAGAGDGLVYDAWNRLVKVYEDYDESGDLDTQDDTLVVTYEYDGQRRRIEANVVGESGLDTYYNTNWQVLEVHEGGDAANPLKQVVWDVRYVDSPVVRFRDGNTDGDYDDAGDDTLYYTTDANMNVTALVDTSGTVLERVVYDPYGNPTFYDGSWTSPSDTSSYDNVVLYCGYRWDGETGLYHVRHRVYHATLGRWNQRDPAGYADSANFYAYVMTSPLSNADPTGLGLWDMVFGTGPRVSRKPAERWIPHFTRNPTRYDRADGQYTVWDGVGPGVFVPFSEVCESMKDVGNRTEVTATYWVIRYTGRNAAYYLDKMRTVSQVECVCEYDVIYWKLREEPETETLIKGVTPVRSHGRAQEPKEGRVGTSDYDDLASQADSHIQKFHGAVDAAAGFSRAPQGSPQYDQGYHGMDSQAYGPLLLAPRSSLPGRAVGRAADAMSNPERYRIEE